MLTDYLFYNLLDQEIIMKEMNKKTDENQLE